MTGSCAFPSETAHTHTEEIIIMKRDLARILIAASWLSFVAKGDYYNAIKIIALH